MAVQNSLTKTGLKTDPTVIRFMAGEEEVKLSPKIVKNYLVSGNAENVTDGEVVMFMNLCKFQHLNPFLREAYCIKYGSQPATIVVSKSALEKRANRCVDYEGFEAGVIVIDLNGELVNRTGTLVLEGETLVGGWCDVYVSRFKHPVKVTVSLSEYIGTKKDGSVNSQWSGKPATMIRKVAKMQALREAFPEDFAGMYSAEEMSVDEPADIPVTPDEIVIEPVEISEPDEQPSFADIMEG